MFGKQFPGQMFSYCIRCFIPCQVSYIFSNLWFQVLIIFSLSRRLPGDINIQMHTDYLCFSEFLAFYTRKKIIKEINQFLSTCMMSISKMKLLWIHILWKLSINQQSMENFHLCIKVAESYNRKEFTGITIVYTFHIQSPVSSYW